MVIAVIILGITCVYLFLTSIAFARKLKEIINYTNKLNRELDNVRTVVIQHSEASKHLTDAVEYLIIKDNAPFMHNMGEGGDA